MSLPALIVITDWSLGAPALLERLRAVVSIGPRVAVQHRHPEATARVFVEEARALRDAIGGNPLFINGRLDVALLLEAHLHLPSAGIRASEARAAMPAGALVSAAVHDEAELAAASGADLILVSPVFTPGSKPEDRRAPLGVAGFDRLAAARRIPAFALGGVGPENAASLPRARGFAVVNGVLRAPDPRLAALRLLARGGPLLA